MSKRSQRGGEFSGREMGAGAPPSTEMPPPQAGGNLPSLSPAAADRTGGYAKSQFYTISGGKRRRSSKRSKRSKRSGSSKRRGRKHKGGNGVLATAAVPFGLLALQRYFKGSKTSKKGVARMGRSFKRTFRYKKGGIGPIVHHRS
jgi:hypothetical protein